MIIGKSNKKIKEIKKLINNSKVRHDRGVFIVEGLRIIKEVPVGRMKECYYTFRFFQYNKRELSMLFDLHKACKFYEISDIIFKSLSDTVSPQGILGVVNIVQYTIDNVISKSLVNNTITKSELILDKYITVVLLEDVQDPGNIGTIIRTSEAAGVSAVILTKNCVDVYAPKVIRSTMGAIFRLPIITQVDSIKIIEKLNKNGFITVATVSSGHLDLYDCRDIFGKYFKKCVVIGNEGNGLKYKTLEMSKMIISIPMEGKVESLNAGIATSIVLYEMRRQNKYCNLS